MDTKKSIAGIFAVLLFMTVLSSCSKKGTGCPNSDFKASSTISLFK